MQPTQSDTLPFRYTPALANEIELKWQDRWEREGTFAAADPELEFHLNPVAAAERHSGFDSEVGDNPHCGLDSEVGVDRHCGLDSEVGDGRHCGLDPQSGWTTPGQPYFIMDMFPYPSGDGLHVGHPLGYIASDVTGRYRRMLGDNVLHAMGFDAFGLPAEQYAVQTGQHPRISTEANIANMKRQLRRLGLAHDPKRSFATIDPDYVRWTQWIFLQIFDSWYDAEALWLDTAGRPRTGKARPIAELRALLATGDRPVPGHDGDNAGGQVWAALSAVEQNDVLNSMRLAYVDESPVNWCPGLGTVLANEEVTADGRSERGNFPVFTKPIRQWKMRITEYASRLVEDLDLIDWPDAVKQMQKNWIGRSTGANVNFHVPGFGSLTVFTTRPDTLYGATFMVVAPEHALTDDVPAEWPPNTDPAWTGGYASPQEAVAAYRSQAAAKTSVERVADAGRKTGVFTGCYAINPLTGGSIPIFTADYVLMGYGTGAIMAVPGGDQRDYEFAKQYHLPIIYTVELETGLPSELNAAYVGDGTVINSPPTIINLGSPVIAGLTPVSERSTPVIAGSTRNPPSTPVSAPSPPVIAGLTRNPASTPVSEPSPPVIAGLTRNPASTPVLPPSTPTSAPSPPVIAGLTRNPASESPTGPDLNGLTVPAAKAKTIEWLEANGIGTGTTTYRLRDWLFSRQRYWGEPFPIVWDENHQPIALPASLLPVELPDVPDYSPRTFEPDDKDSMPEAPLGRSPEWVNITLDLGDGPKQYQRDTNTMPNWAGSCWYYLRYLDPLRGEANEVIEKPVENYWMGPHHNNTSGAAGGVDLYIGGVEHAVLHLLYARFWHKVLFDLGYVSSMEPFGRLFNQGYIQAYAYTDDRGVYVPASQVTGDEATGFEYNGEKVNREFGKMGKSLKNVVTPDEMARDYGIDTFRTFEMVGGPLDISRPWETRDVIGSQRFLQRLWRNVINEETGEVTITDEPADLATKRLTHNTINDVTIELANMRPNTAIAKLIVLNNHLTGLNPVPREAIEPLLLMLAPIAPHISEELWERLGHPESLARHPFPVADPQYLVAETVTCILQVNGKVRSRIEVSPDITDAELEQAALNDEGFQRAIEGKPIRKTIVRAPKLVNVVV